MPDREVVIERLGWLEHPHSRVSLRSLLLRLARLPRYGGRWGAEGRPWSVLEHTLVMALGAQQESRARGEGLGIEVARESMIHDLHEGLTGDSHYLLKRLVPEIRPIEEGVQEELRARLGLSPAPPEEEWTGHGGALARVRDLDTRVLPALEARQLGLGPFFEDYYKDVVVPGAYEAAWTRIDTLTGWDRIATLTSLERNRSVLTTHRAVLRARHRKLVGFALDTCRHWGLTSLATGAWPREEGTGRPEEAVQAAERGIR